MTTRETVDMAPDVAALPEWRIDLLRYMHLPLDGPIWRRRPGTIISRDPEAIASALLIKTTFRHRPLILDTTYNRGRMWQGLPVQPTAKSDLIATAPDVVVAAWDDLARVFAGQVFDMLVFDPPHQSDAGHNQDAEWAESYGTRSLSVRRRGQANVSHLFAPFFEQASQLLTPEGIVLVKISDQAHAQRKQLQWHLLWQAALQCGWNECDIQIKPRRARPDPKHKRVLHYGNSHSYFPVYRRGNAC